MANSTSASLKLTVQATGENSGTWGQITNTNLLILEQAIGGFQSVAITTGATLTFSNGALSNGKNQVLKLTGTIAGAVNVVIPDSIEKTFVVENATSGAHAVTFKTSSGTGVTWVAADKGTKMIYSDGTNVVDTEFTDLSSDYSPQLSADLDTNSQNIIIDTAHGILDENSNQQITFTTAASAVNEFTVANAATGNAPEISATGGDSNIDLNLTPKGVGRATFNGQGKIQSVAEKCTNSATAATGTVNYDVLTQAVLNYTSNASGNWTLNIRGDGSNSLDSIMDTGESITIAHLVPQGGSAYYNSAVQIDGSSVTPEWQGGAAPDAGNASSIDVYTYTIIKTGSATFTALASLSQFA
jgi:hypothetical protein|tara:strand:+ start:1601 stop:2671 length:1071 start_codon:yes stop_codon:yes gene_type:complete